MRQVYENRAQNPAEAKRVNELEQEVLRTKTYYQKRIRELEDKYKFKVNMGKVEEGLSDLIENKPLKSERSSDGKKTESDKIKKLTEDRDILAGRLVESQSRIEQLQERVDQLESEKSTYERNVAIDAEKSQAKQNSSISATVETVEV